MKGMAARQCYRPPWNINQEGDLQRVVIDFHDAEKKLKRERVRAEKRESDGDADGQ